MLEEAGRDKQGAVLWKCVCNCKNDNPNIVYVNTANLKRGSSKSCGCLQKEKVAATGKANCINLTGQQFNSLTVVEKAISDNGRTYWMCKCSCGNPELKKIDAYKLKTGHTKTCGQCKNFLPKPTILPKESFIGKQFGKLTVLKDSGERTKNQCIIWKCKCECGNITFANTDVLNKGEKISCGCLNKSHGEYKIQQLLIKYNILFEEEKTFPTCKISTTPLRFDFYVNNQYLIEFDGRQHFYARNAGWDTDEHLTETHMRDMFKNQWCQNNNIELIRIPYWHLENIQIQDLMLETSQFIFKKESEKKYYEEYYQYLKRSC